MILSDKLQVLRDRFERLSQRERTLVGAMGITFVAMLTLIVGFVITDGLSTFEGRNADMRQALRDLETRRGAYLRAKEKAAQLETRIGRTPIQLQGYLEEAAKAAGVEIPESNERPAEPAGKRFVERAVDLHLRQVTLDALGRFLKGIETGPNVVVVTALSIRTRDDKHQELDVEMSVSTFEHAPEKKDRAGGRKGDKS